MSSPFHTQLQMKTIAENNLKYKKSRNDCLLEMKHGAEIIVNVSRINHIDLNNTLKTNLNILKRIYHIFNALLILPSLEDKIENFYDFIVVIIRDIKFMPPWDSESIINHQLHNLCLFLKNNMVNEKSIENACSEDLSKVSIQSEIDKILKIE